RVRRRLDLRLAYRRDFSSARRQLVDLAVGVEGQGEPRHRGCGLRGRRWPEQHVLILVPAQVNERRLAGDLRPREHDAKPERVPIPRDRRVDILALERSEKGHRIHLEAAELAERDRLAALVAHPLALSFWHAADLAKSQD